MVERRRFRIGGRLRLAKSARKETPGKFRVGKVSGRSAGGGKGALPVSLTGPRDPALETAYEGGGTLPVKNGFSLFHLDFGQGEPVSVAETIDCFYRQKPGECVWRANVKKGGVCLIVLAAGLWSIFGGQAADFPNPTRLHAASFTPAPKPAAPSLPPGATQKPFENKAPDFTLPSLDGSQVSLSSYRGKKAVVLVFFATWCVNCMKEVPEIKKFALVAQKENIVVLAINFKQRKSVVEKFQKSSSIPYPILLDADGEVTLGKFGIKGIPHIIGIDSKGEMIYRGEDLPVNRTEFIEKLIQGP